jgi:hypothetical protein
MALDSIGYGKHIAEPYEGSPAARVALEIHAQTRDELIQSGDWAFALREVALIPSGQVPPSPWLEEFQYPSDCVRIRYIRPGDLTGGTRSNNPGPVLFRPWNDPRIPAQAILCDISPATLIYSGQVTDPSQWDSGFTQAYVSAMAQKLAFGLNEQAEIIKARIGLTERDIQQGMSMDDTTVAEPSNRREVVK